MFPPVILFKNVILYNIIVNFNMRYRHCSPHMDGECFFFILRCTCVKLIFYFDVDFSFCWLNLVVGW